MQYAYPVFLSASLVCLWFNVWLVWVVICSLEITDVWYNVSFPILFLTHLRSAKIVLPIVRLAIFTATVWVVINHSLGFSTKITGDVWPRMATSMMDLSFVKSVLTIVKYACLRLTVFRRSLGINLIEKLEHAYNLRS